MKFISLTGIVQVFKLPNNVFCGFARLIRCGFKLIGIAFVNLFLGQLINGDATAAARCDKVDGSTLCYLNFDFTHDFTVVWLVEKQIVITFGELGLNNLLATVLNRSKRGFVNFCTDVVFAERGNFP